MPVQAVVKRLQEACAERIHEFWPDEPSLLDSGVFDATRIHGPRQITDVYLLGLAVQHRPQVLSDLLEHLDQPLITIA